MKPYLKFIEIIAVLSILHHSTKHQQSCSITDKTICCTTRWDVATDCWDEPLVGCYIHLKKGDIKHGLQLGVQIHFCHKFLNHKRH